MIILKNIFLSFVISSGFAVMFKVPKDSVALAGIAGVVQWMIYFILKDTQINLAFIYFLASLGAGVTGEIFAKLRKKPALLFVVPGLIPLVPGAGIYYTMFYLVKHDAKMAFNKGVETFLLALAIASGIVLSSMFSSSVRGRIQKILDMDKYLDKYIDKYLDKF